MKFTVGTLIAVLTLIVLHAPPASAGTNMEGTITRLYLKPHENKVLIKMTGQTNNPAACKNNPNYDFAFMTDTVEGMLTYASVVSAYNHQTLTIINGDGTCDLYSGVETLLNIIHR